MAGLINKAQRALGAVRALREEIRQLDRERIAPVAGGGGGGGADLAAIGRGVQEILSAVRPSAAEKRSVI